MEYLFQADINGALERLDKIESGQEQADHRSSTDIILCALKPTLDSLDPKHESMYLQAPGHQTGPQDPNEVCHAVLFKAWMQRSDALTSFSVSRYSRGVHPMEYYQLVETLNLIDHFKFYVYGLDLEIAVSALQDLLPHIETCRLYDYLPIYLRVYQAINSEQTFRFAMDHLDQQLHQHTLDTPSVQQLLVTLLSIYASDIQLSSYQCLGFYRLVTHLHHSSQDIIQQHLLSTWKRLLRLIHRKYNVGMPLPDDPVIPKQVAVVDSRLWTKSDPLALWHATSDMSPQQRHEYAFELICNGIWKNAVPSRISEPPIAACDVLMAHLTQDVRPDLYGCMMACLETVKHRAGAWKSIVKAITQFSDIWVRLLPTTECMMALADLIVMAGTWTCLYQFVINVINVPCGTMELVNEQQKSSLCALVRMVIQQLPTPVLLELIYDTYKDRTLPNDDILHKRDLFNDTATLQKCCNQLVQTEQDVAFSSDPKVEPRLLHQLAMLAVLSPYETVWRLVNHGLEKKGQHDLVVSILRQLGDLCMLQRYPEDMVLIGHIIGFILANSHQYNGLDTLAPLLLSCWKYARNPSISILLDSYGTLLNNTTHSQIIINPKILFDDYLLPALQQSERPTLTNHILGLFYALTEDGSPTCENWRQQLDQHISFIPILLEMDVAILMKALAEVLDKRYTMGDVSMHELSIALDLGRKLTMVIQHVFTVNTPDRLADVKMKLLGFYDTLDDYDWRTRLFWQQSYQHVIANDSMGFHVPFAVATLLWSLTDTVGKKDDFLWVPDKKTDMGLDNDSQWMMLLSGCRSSTLLTDELFKYTGTRLYNMGPIWKHPYECSLFHQHLTRILHPSFSTAAHYEYKLVLIHFLGRLYDAHENGNDLIHLYQYYEPTAAPLVKLLLAEHCRIFFMAMHSVLLLKTPSLIKPTDDGTTIEDGELYYVSGIVQTIQTMANWQQLDDTNPAMTRKQISSMAQSPENRIEPDEPTKQEIVDCYYPWMNDQKRSGRALCLLMIQLICQVAGGLQLRKSYDVLRVLLVQMVAGVEDRQERDAFMDVSNKQTKSFINKWKKNKKDHRIRVHLRPTLACHEMDLIQQCYSQLPSTDDQAILRHLLSPTSLSPIVYIYTSHC